MRSAGGDVYTEGFRAGWRPDPYLTVSEWADRDRVLGNRSGHAPRRWSTATTPYLREIMDALGPRSPAREIVFMSGTQLGKTEAGLNWVGYVMSQAPASMLMLRPTVEDARRFSRQRLDPMITTTLSLAGLVREPRAREGGNTLLIKEFAGGVLFLTGSNSATGVKSMPIRNVFGDEIDEYPGDVDDQGDPIALARKRTTGPDYARRKIYLVSTPTVKGLSRIEAELEDTDLRRFYVPCPTCGNMDFMRWANMRWAEGEPRTAHLVCVACERPIDERFKPIMLARGAWRATRETTDRERVGYHLSSLYSPLGWFPWSSAVAEFLKARNDPMKLKTWVNTVLGETWEDRGLTIEVDDLVARCEKYEAPVPAGVGVLVASVDVQDDRLEAQVKGYGAGEESWLVAFRQFYGDPAQDAVWLEVDRFLAEKHRNAAGRLMPVACTTVDSGGHHTERVYQFCKARAGRRIFAVRGGSERGKPLVSRPTMRNRYRTQLFTLCVDTGKEIVYSRLKIGTPGPGYCHLPAGLDPEYLEQLTAEKALRKWVKGRGTVREWVKVRERNEALDLEVYSLAALHILGAGFMRRLPEEVARWNRPLEAGETKAARPARRRRKSWATDF